MAILAACARAGAGGPAGEIPRTVERIVVAGCRTVDPTVVEGQIRTRAGDPYSAETAQADVRRILDLGLFTNCRVDVTAGETGAILTYTVTERRRVDRIDVRGRSSVREETVLTTSGLRGLTFVDDFHLLRAARDVEALYHERGYTFAKVTAAVEPIDGQAVAVIDIREGPHVRLEAIDFRGVTAFTADVLRSRMTSKPAFKVLRFLRPGTFNEEVIQEDVRRVRDFYLEEGYLNADTSYELEFSPTQETVTVHVLVREGQPFRVGTVEVRGATIFSAAEVVDEMGLRRGTRYTTAALSADRRAIERMYGRLGYMTTQVRIETRFTTTPDVVDLVVTIQEGQQVRLAAVRVEGNNKTARHVILREMRLDPGRVLDTDLVDESERRLNRLRYFSTVSLDRLEGPREDEKDLVVEVEEDRTADILLGAAVGTETGLTGSITYVQRNFDISRLPRSFSDIVDGYAFAGGGQTFRVSAEPGTELQQYMVSFTEPYLFGSDFGLGLKGFLSERAREDYDEGRKGVEVRVGRRLTDYLRGDVTARYEAIDISDVGDGAPTDLFDVEGNSTLTSLGLTLTHETLDDVLDPTTGHRLSATVEQAGALGGDYDFTRLLLRAGWYTPVVRGANGRGDHVLSLGGRLGLIVAGDAPIFERFYAGGTYTMRGFAYRGLGPHEGDDPIGGDFLAVGSVEYTFPLVDRTLRGVVFVDVGTVEEDIEIRTLRASVGFGLRLYLGGAMGSVPMQFNFAFPVAKDGDDETEVFSFVAGTRLW